MTDAAISRRSARPHETRDQILRAASELFAARGFHRTTIRAIADRAELSNTLLYYYFKNKHELLEALLVSREMSTTPPGETWDFREAWQLSEQLAYQQYWTLLLYHSNILFLQLRVSV